MLAFHGIPNTHGTCAEGAKTAWPNVSDSGSTSLSIVLAVARQMGMSFAVSALTLDERASRKDIDQKFGELEKTCPARKTGDRDGASSHPVTLERIANWTHQLRARGFVLAPGLGADKMGGAIQRDSARNRDRSRHRRLDRYRPCVGILLLNDADEIFVGERLDAPEAWQMPQGGIDPGESAR